MFLEWRSSQNMLVTSNVFSILYYNSDIWHLPTLNSNLKCDIRSSSVNALKMCATNYNYWMSYYFLHTINKRAQPNHILKFKLTLMLFKMYRDQIPTIEWVALNNDQIFTSGLTKCIESTSSSYKVRLNIPIRRLTVTSNKIEIWLAQPKLW
jgi:hypothetical protein